MGSIVFLFCLLPALCFGQKVGAVSKEIIECIQLVGNGTDLLDVPHVAEGVHARCLREFLWKADNVNWEKVNVTETDKNFMDSLITSYVHRTRREAKGVPNLPGGLFPKTGFRIRREYRLLSDTERMALHKAINVMKKTGVYDMIANVHRGKVVATAHLGPNLFGWHRIYTALAEEALRRVNPKLALPYWDTTIDFDMKDPTKSIIWTKGFMGNGDGYVNTGPFAGWMTPYGRLTRNIGGTSKLITKQDLAMFLSKCSTSEVSFPTAKMSFNIDYMHGGPHLWVGGQMAGLNTAAHDPIFFLYHSFIDYIWEMFRKRQMKVCGVNPAKDYPKTSKIQAPGNRMIGFPQYRNIDGYSNIWTTQWYNYEPSPMCSAAMPSCGSPYLWCDVKRGRCIAAAGMTFANGGPMVGRKMESTIKIGPVFVGPPPEPRTQDAKKG